MTSFVTTKDWITDGRHQPYNVVALLGDTSARMPGTALFQPRVEDYALFR